MSFWCLQISQKPTKFFPGFLPKKRSITCSRHQSPNIRIPILQIFVFIYWRGDKKTFFIGPKNNTCRKIYSCNNMLQFSMYFVKFWMQCYKKGSYNKMICSLYWKVICRYVLCSLYVVKELLLLFNLNCLLILKLKRLGYAIALWKSS